MPATLQVAVDPSTLTVGTKQGAIIIAVPNATPATITIPVTYTVRSGTVPTLDVDTDHVTFTTNTRGAAVRQVIRVSNSGGDSLTFTASAPSTPDSSWLSVSPSSGTATSSSPAYVTVTVTATPGALTTGTYSSTITIQGTNGTKIIPVTLSLSATSATILRSLP